MKKSSIYILLPLLLIIFSCEDPIEVTLSDSEQLVVVDAWLDNTNSTQEITLRQSIPYFDSTTVVAIEDATVVVNSSAGLTMNFEHTSNGKYEWSSNDPIGQIGDAYTLTINHGSETYSSTTVLNRVPEIDSIRLEFVDDDPFNDDGIYAEFISRDLVGLDDTYWIKTYKNGDYFNKPEEINIAWDAGFDSGGDVDGLIFIPPLRFLTNQINEEGGLEPWEIGEVCRVEIHSISNDAFGFLEIMRDQLLNGGNGIFAEPLANTRGNIESTGSKNVLGIFNVAAISSLERTIE